MKEKLMILGKRILKHELVNGSLFVFGGYIFASFLNFVLNVFLVRNLTSSDYGTYASLLSLFTLASIPSQSVTPIVVRFATGFFAKNEKDKASNFYIQISKYIITLSVLIFFSFILFSAPIKNFLNLDNVWYVILIGLIVCVSYIVIVNLAFLQSLLKFSFVSLSFALLGVVRIAAAILLVFLGFKVFGALWAILIATLIPFFIQFIPLKSLIFRKNKENSRVSGREVLNYAFPTSIAVLSLMSLTSTDVILAKHFFSSQNAGLYSGLSLIGKVIFYFTGPISSVMFPILVKRHNLGQNFNNIFYLSIFLVTIPSLFIVLVYFIKPILIIRIFFGGGEYLKIAPYLGLFGILLTVFSILNVCVNFFLSLKKTKIAVAVFSAAILQIFLINFFHNTFLDFIKVSLAVSIGLLIVLLFYFLKFYKNLNRIKNTVSLSTSV